MPSALHPRSRTTLSLFTSTLVLSFAVVALPHIIPCPVPHKTRVYADGEVPTTENGKRRRRKSSSADSEDRSGSSREKPSARECPVPKPSGLIGQVLGFRATEKREYPLVRVEKYLGPSRTSSTESKDS
jgi:cytochrome c oxidase assembly factor 2